MREVNAEDFRAGARVGAGTAAQTLRELSDHIRWELRAVIDEGRSHEAGSTIQLWRGVEFALRQVERRGVVVGDKEAEELLASIRKQLGGDFETLWDVPAANAEEEE